MLLVTGYHPYRNLAGVTGLVIPRQVQSTALSHSTAGQLVAGMEPVPGQAAHALSLDGGRAAETGRHLEAIGHAQVGTATPFGKVELDIVTGG